MSADNFIAIQQIGGRWYVWGAGASDELHLVPLDRARNFRFGFSARRYARRLHANTPVVEYGIQELGAYDEWRDYYQDAIIHMESEYWAMVDNFQNRARKEGVH